MGHGLANGLGGRGHGGNVSDSRRAKQRPHKGRVAGSIVATLRGLIKSRAKLGCIVTLVHDVGRNLWGEWSVE